jgi:methylated-DNA-[protein]-cysteine S-methyltransferase
MESPVGPLLLTSDGTHLTGLYMNEHRHGPDGVGEGWVENEDAAPLSEAKRQLAAYFAGERTDFDLPLAAEGTDFQQRVWRALRAIPFGRTCSYREVAATIGVPRGSQAVGQANRRNPIPIVVPCHRVLDAKGGIGGFMGAGPDGPGSSIKRWLLAHERSLRPPEEAAAPDLFDTP